jgi:beta-glucosidase
MPWSLYFRKDSLLKAIKEGLVSEDVINDKVRRQLRVRFEAGLFDKQEITDTSVINSDSHKKLTLKVAQEGIVLLKNDNILPLDKNKLKSIAVIGPNANIARTGGGGSSFVSPFYSVSPLEGITKAAGNTIKIEFAQGDVLEDIRINPVASKYLFTPDKKSNGLLGEYFNNKNLKGNPSVIKVDSIVNFDFGISSPVKELNCDLFSIRWTGFIVPPVTRFYKIDLVNDDGARLYINNKLLIDDWKDHHAKLNTVGINLEAGKEYKIKIEYYDNMGRALVKLGWDADMMNKNSDPIYQASEVAKRCDVAVVFAGASDYIESEGRDRNGLELPGKQDELIEAVVKANPNTIVVINGGTSVKVDKWIKQVKGLVNMFYSGQETGNAIASILFGNVNPSGKLPFSFISDYNQSPAFKEYKDKSLKIHYNEGVFVGYRYLDINNLEPAFPFGFGLSYTTFEYSNLSVKQLQDKNFEISLRVRNTGKVPGDEIVQLYVSEIECSVPRPVKELKSFSRVTLDPDEEKIVTMKLHDRSFAFWDNVTKNWKIEPGEFEILIGSSSRDIRLKHIITIK